MNNDRRSTARDASTHGYADAVVAAVLALAEPPRRSDAPLLLGLSGLQGSGKSTLAAQVVAAARARGIAAVTMSIDDFYLGRAARQRLARDVHPLLATRGVPGTHDIALLRRTLAQLRCATPRAPARIPRFDKGLDSRVPRARWTRVTSPPAFVVLEGWCIGVPMQPAAALRRPVNALERDEDRDGRWRAWVNHQLAAVYAPLWRELDRLAVLRAPDFSVVARWRDEQERALRRRHAPRAMTPAQLRRFLMFYERLSRWALRALPARADLAIELDDRRNVVRTRRRRRAAR
jgi:D-glycerate 3-kinase